jgi:hypothetical protein
MEAVFEAKASLNEMSSTGNCVLFEEADVDAHVGLQKPFIHSFIHSFIHYYVYRVKSVLDNYSNRSEKPHHGIILQIQFGRPRPWHDGWKQLSNSVTHDTNVFWEKGSSFSGSLFKKYRRP